MDKFPLVARHDQAKFGLKIVLNLQRPRESSDAFYIGLLATAPFRKTKVSHFLLTFSLFCLRRF